MPLLALATGTLAATKNEGAVLAVALVAAAVIVAGPRRAFPAAAAVAVAVLAWHLVVPAGLTAVDADMAPSLARASAHAAALPAALARAIARTPTIAVTLAAWFVWVVSSRGPELRGVRLAFGLWAVAVLGAYLSTTADLTWHLAASADRVLGAPLPAALALAVGARFSGSPAAAAASAPASSRGGSPSG